MTKEQYKNLNIFKLLDRKDELDKMAKVLKIDFENSEVYKDYENEVLQAETEDDFNDALYSWLLYMEKEINHALSGLKYDDLMKIIKKWR